MMPAREHAFLPRVEHRDLLAIVQLHLQLPRIDAPDVIGQS
jgi:DNA-directed RNA polymerase subunit H (RpoH/RPB5)